MSTIPFSRLVAVETRKMFDTRSGLWLMLGIVVSATIASAGVLAFGHASAVKWGNFGAAAGIPMSILLPIIAILAVTGEWSQRAGLTTFTLVPHRDRVILAKLAVIVLTGAVAIPLTMAIAALGNVIGGLVHDVTPVWDMSLTALVLLVLGNVLGMLVGFALGVLFRSSAAAVVGYFVYGFILPGIFGALSGSQEWFRKVEPWIDFRVTSGILFDHTPSAREWAEILVSSLPWLVLPLGLGLWLVSRTEVK